MKIFGIGTDIINIKRMEKSLKKHGDKFKNNIFVSVQRQGGGRYGAKKYEKTPYIPG